MTIETIKKNSRAKISFPVIIQEDEDGGYVVTNPSLEGCYSQGETIEEALANIKEATELCMGDGERNCVVLSSLI